MGTCPEWDRGRPDLPHPATSQPPREEETGYSRRRRDGRLLSSPPGAGTLPPAPTVLASVSPPTPLHALESRSSTFAPAPSYAHPTPTPHPSPPTCQLGPLPRPEEALEKAELYRTLAASEARDTFTAFNDTFGCRTKTRVSNPPKGLRQPYLPLPTREGGEVQVPKEASRRSRREDLVRPFSLETWDPSLKETLEVKREDIYPHYCAETLSSGHLPDIHPGL